MTTGGLLAWKYSASSSAKVTEINDSAVLLIIDFLNTPRSCTNTAVLCTTLLYSKISPYKVYICFFFSPHIVSNSVKNYFYSCQLRAQRKHCLVQEYPFTYWENKSKLYILLFFLTPPKNKQTKTQNQTNM